MNGVLVFVVLVSVLALLFFALVEMAFALLMRLPQRLEAERESEGDALGSYLDDPLKFFIPARLIRGMLVILIIVLLAQSVGTGWTAGLTLFGIGLGLAIGVGQILPALIVRRGPERILELLLPAFTLVANVLAPVTAIVISFAMTALFLVVLLAARGLTGTDHVDGREDSR